MNALLSNGTNLIVFVVMLGLLVLVHEVGHFVVSKRLHVPVLEFGIGLPPRLVRLMKRGETEYTLNALPIGGFVRLMGEDDPNVPGGFATAAPSVRASVLLAGVTMNLVLAFLALALGAFFTPPYAEVHTTRIAAIAENSPAALAGLRVGDTIVAVDTQDVKGDYYALSRLLRQNAGRQVMLSVVRGAQTLDPIPTVPRVNPPAGEGPLGVALNGWLGLRVSSVESGSIAERASVRAGDVLVFFVDPLKGRPLKDQGELAQFTTTHPGWKIEWHIARSDKLLDPIIVQIPDALDPKDATLGLDLQTSLFDAPWQAAQQMWQIAATIPVLLSQAVTGSVPANSFVGFIGIYQATSEVAQRGGSIALIRFLGLLSMNLAIVNLLPFPGLDGGRLVFVVLEWLRGGKKVAPQKEGLVHLVGLAILVGLMLVISFFDIQRLLSGQPILP